MKQEREYPELEGTTALCKEMIEARANESVPAPGEPASELHRVRKSKEQHIKQQNWELAAAYREVEKLLQDREPKCANCQYMLSAIGVGQGLICELNLCRIPHSEHSCQYHWYGPNSMTKSAETASFDSEDIEQLAWDNACLSRRDVYELFEEVFKEKKMRGSGFDVSASKEVSEFKRRLRELAKQRYEQHSKQEPSENRLTDEAIYAESEKQGYTQLATRIAWEQGAMWCRGALQR